MELDPILSAEEKKPTTKLMVLRSRAVYYIGRLQRFDDCAWMPYSRESDYYLVERNTE